MRRARYESREKRLLLEKKICYKGTASIKIEVLDFRPRKVGESDDRNVNRLKKAFREPGACERLNLRNHVLGIIDQSTLDAALHVAGIPSDCLFKDPSEDYPKLDFPAGYKLECIQGQSRTRAAPPGDQRWTVDLYLSGMQSVYPVIEVLMRK